MNQAARVATYDRVARLRIPDRAGPQMSAREADVELLASAPRSFLDTTHFDTVRFPPPPWAKDVFAKAASDGSLAYTPYRGHPDVLAALSKSISAFMGVSMSTENLLLTPGTQAGLFTALGALVDEGDQVALIEPDYLFSERILRFYGAQLCHVPMTSDERQVSPDLAALERAFARGARVLVFSHPNNPTGAIYSKDALDQIAQLVKQYGVTVIADELYSRLIHEGSFPHFAALPGMMERTITLLGPSKTESLSGYRLGVVVAPTKFIARIEDVLSITSLRAPGYAQHLLRHWLVDDQDWLRERLTDFRALRTLTEQKLKKLPWLKLTMQRGTAYCWPDVSALQLSGREVATALLKEAGVLVSPGYQFGPSSDGHFRVCYARDEEEWMAALDRMMDVLGQCAAEQGVT